MARVPVARLTDLGEIQLGPRAALGETVLRAFLAVRPGTWRVFYLDEDGFDALVDEGLLPEPDVEVVPQLLLLVHTARALPDDAELATLAEVERIDIEAARFTLADAALAPALESEDGFYEHLDGVHGYLRTQNGVTVSLMGDGHARVRSTPGRPADVVAIELW